MTTTPSCIQSTRSALLAVMAACWWIESPAIAKRVELLAFELPRPENDFAPPPVEALLSADALAADFGALAPAMPGAETVSTIAMPAWQRPRDAQNGTMPPPSTEPAGCPTPAYRPRRDLMIATELRRARLYPLVVQAACEAGIPVGLFDALVVQESRYNLAAVSPKGAIGLSQLMPGTARYLSVADPFDALSNLRGGARYLREQLTTFGRVDLALAAYNAGPGRVRARWAVPRIAETKTYVTNVTRGWHIGVVREVALLNFRQRPPTAPIAKRVASLALFDDEQ